MNPAKGEDDNPRFQRGQVIRRHWIFSNVEEVFLIKEPLKRKDWYLAYCVNDGIEGEYSLDDFYSGKRSYICHVVEG